MAWKFVTLVALFYLFIVQSFSAETTDKLRQGESLSDWKQLTSAKGIFKLGFFTLSSSTYPTPSTNHYLGIWYDRVPNNPVWVANHESPVLDSSGALVLGYDGQLKIEHQGGTILVSNQTTKMPARNVSATLLDTGNLVLQNVYENGSLGEVLWQSFDYPTNMLVPGMKLGMNLKTGHHWSLTSWLSDTVPAPGAFKLGLDPNGSDQLVISRRGQVYWTSGLWKNGSFEKAPEVTQSLWVFDFRFVSNENEKYFAYSVKNNYTFARWELDLSGQIMQFFLINNVTNNGWYWRYAALCDRGLKYDSAVCLKEKPVACRRSSEFFVTTRGYFVDAQVSYEYENNGNTLALSDCHGLCWNNCSCVAYGSASTDGIGCLFWTNGSKFVVDENSSYQTYVLNTKYRKV